MSPRNAFLVCWLSLSAPVGATEFSRPVQQAPGNGQALLAVELDSQIYAASAADFGDLRLSKARLNSGQSGVEIRTGN
ncbi:hypothetical protein RPD76_07495 [Methylomonas sp. MV1]|uniref:hypothetical protein n=1 Tax=Methylomonas sp. MV1 TaxID=3073620 RepID=UPI0028A4DF70|nr:hypothetical protein [Methylomonas sp. MV1]MDT4329749.1 hypothetical protein [Methylomonas sp. MV1]